MENKHLLTQPEMKFAHPNVQSRTVFDARTARVRRCSFSFGTSFSSMSVNQLVAGRCINQLSDRCLTARWKSRRTLSSYSINQFCSPTSPFSSYLHECELYGEADIQNRVYMMNMRLFGSFGGVHSKYYSTIRKLHMVHSGFAYSSIFRLSFFLI